MSETNNREKAMTAQPKRCLRKWHGLFGLVSAPFTLITAVCGGLLLLRTSGLYERRGAFRDAIQGLHSFEILLPYVGLVAVALMIGTVLTGVGLKCQMRRKK